MIRRDDRGQGNTEYALLIVVVLALFGVLLAATRTHAPEFVGHLWSRLIDAVKS